MKVACFYFSAAGELIANQLSAVLPHKLTLFSKLNYKASLAAVFREYDALVFISATGSAVRLIAPFIQSKTDDPAVVVIDDTGKFVISLLSGHIGGANQLTNEIAEITKAISVVTTASDNRGFQSLDLFAKQYQLAVENTGDMNKIMSKMVNGETIGFFADDRYQLDYPNINNQIYTGAIYVTNKTKVSNDAPFCILRPRNLNIGIGCRKGKSSIEILAFINSIFKANHLSLPSINKVASIIVKSEEPGIIDAAEKLDAELAFFTEGEIKKVQKNYSRSDFVEQSVGVTSVCEPCAELCGGKLIIQKQTQSGITLAVSEEL